MKKYFTPLAAGPESEPLAAGRRVACLIKALATEVTDLIGTGGLVDDVRLLRIKLVNRLQAEGWRIERKRGNSGWWVIPPSPKKGGKGIKITQGGNHGR